MEIRPAERRDVDAVQRIARTTWHATYDEIIGSTAVDETVDEWYAEAVVRADITDDETVYLVAVDDDIVGYAAGGPVDDAESGALYAIYVHPDRWGDGIGSRLFDAVTERLRDRAFERCQIRVLADNDRARAFYERHGYTVSDREQAELAGVEATEVVYDGAL